MSEFTTADMFAYAVIIGLSVLFGDRLTAGRAGWQKALLTMGLAFFGVAIWRLTFGT